MALPTAGRHEPSSSTNPSTHILRDWRVALQEE
jgi:hypothetical protein